MTPISDETRKLLRTSDLPDLGPGPRAEVRSSASLESLLKSLFAGTQLSPVRQELVRALVLLWHDDLDAAHTIAQSVEGADGAFVHGIMHRREPDYDNASYWFRRVGSHPAFPEISRRADEFLAARGETSLQARLLPGGNWDPFAFVKACEEAGKGRIAALPLRELQKIETEVLLEHFCK